MFGLTVQLDQTGQGNLPGQPYKYNGKELEKSFGLEYYYYGARQYDPQRAQWTGIDPLADKYYGISPFAYVANNPIKYIDPNGKEIKIGYFEMGRSGPERKGFAIYRAGNLYNEDGSAYTGNNQYILTVQQDLITLRGGNFITKGIIDQLDNSTASHMIGNMDFKDSKKDIEKDEHYNQKNNNRSVSDTEDPRDSYTKYTANEENWGPDITTGKFKVTTRSRTSGLMHELVHGYDKDINRKRSETTREEEGRALSVENTVEGNRGRLNHGKATYTPEELENFKNDVKNDVENNSH